YLISLAVGHLDLVEAPPLPANQWRARPVPLRGVAARGQGGKLGFALQTAAAELVELERYFGIAYPYDKLDLIAVPDFAPGAMENAGAITFRDLLLLLDEQAPVGLRRNSAWVMAHEIA